jgi:hypothetical protein
MTDVVSDDIISGFNDDTCKVDNDIIWDVDM